MFIDKHNIYYLFFLSGILLLVLFVSRFSFMEGLETTPVVNATPTTVESTTTTKPVSQVVTKPVSTTKPVSRVVTKPVSTTTPVIQATSPPTVTTDPIPISSKPINNLASLTETPTVSTATIVKISDIQSQVTNLRNILQKDVVIQATDAVQLLQNNQDIKKALSMIIDKPVRKEIDIIIENINKIHMNLYVQTMQIQDNLTNFKNQYQNL